MITRKMLENANKVSFIIQQYPEKTLTEVIALLQMPAIDINSCIWAAQELGFISEADLETGRVELLTPPETWDFGNDVKELQDMLVYSLTQLAKKEQDLEEVYMSNWTGGYPSQDLLVAVRHLMQEQRVADYQLTDPKDLKSTYTFYTLFENREQLWGQKQFAVEPTGAEKPEVDEPPAPTEPEAPTEEAQ